jgi:predicted Zn-dependent protease
MMEQLMALLRACRQIDGFKLVEESTEAEEYFLVKQELDLHRAKTVRKIRMTLYKDFEADGIKYKGAAGALIHPTWSGAELEKVIAETAFAAGLVKNPYYPLIKPFPAAETTPDATASSCPATIFTIAPDLLRALLKTDRTLAGRINAAELFISRVAKRVINSEGVDYSGKQVRSYLELIATWPGAREEAELYLDLQMAAFTPELLTARTRDLLLLCREKAAARPTPALRKHTVILTGEPVRAFLNYYYEQTAAQSVYEGISTLQLGKPAQGEAIRGERLNLALEPQLPNSDAMLNFDADGTWLRPATIIQNGIVQSYWGEQQYAYYLGIPATGLIRNTIFGTGARTMAELKREPHLEVLAFSDFQVNPVTGAFGGEIRLGRYFDGQQVSAVTGGSISGNIQTVQGELFCSKERQTVGNFSGPQSLRLAEVTVAGSQTKRQEQKS